MLEEPWSPTLVGKVELPRESQGRLALEPKSLVRGTGGQAGVQE